MPDPIDAVPMILQQIQASIARVESAVGDARAEARTDKAEITKRLDGLRQALNGESVLGRLMANEVEERLAAIEARLARVEQSAGLG